MKLNKDYFDEAMEVLKQRRDKNKLIEKQRREEISVKLPQLKEIEDELARTMRDLVNSVINKSGADTQNEIIQRNRGLMERFNKTLTDNGYPEDYLEPVYHCAKCKDTGNTGNEWCECFCRLSNEFAAAKLNENAPLERCTFERFDIKRYSDKAPDGELSPRKIMEDNLKCCEKFTKDFDGTGSGFLMYGGTGLGKTHLSLAVANELIAKGFCVLYGSCAELVRKINNEQFGKSQGNTLELATGCDLLILDDLGAEHITDWSVSILYEIINTRINRRLPMIVNTNYSIEDIKTFYQDRLSSRLFSMKILLFAGDDNRHR